MPTLLLHGEALISRFKQYYGGTLKMLKLEGASCFLKSVWYNQNWGQKYNRCGFSKWNSFYFICLSLCIFNSFFFPIYKERCVYMLGMHKDSTSTGLTSMTLTAHESQKAHLRESQLILELISFMCCKIYWIIKQWTHLYFPICSFCWFHSTAFFLTEPKPDLLYFDNIWTNYFLEQPAPTLG